MQSSMKNRSNQIADCTIVGADKVYREEERDMQLGWIDFSKTERSKVLGVLELLGQGTLDELGIAAIRDGFANLFFPGTSTIQTRAKYFFLVPYIMKTLERSGVGDPRQLKKILDEEEHSCGQLLLDQNEDENGLIGSRSLKDGGWVKRVPSDIYWAGLRKYGIFLDRQYSIFEYLRAVSRWQEQKSVLRMSGKHRLEGEDEPCDDQDAGNLHNLRFWNIPTYRPDWKEFLTMKLTAEEAKFLRTQILDTCGGSLLAYILENREVLACERFKDLEGFAAEFPEQLQQDYHLAVEFSDFLFAIRTVYNIMVSDGKNEAANQIFAEEKERYPQYAQIDLNAVFDRLQIQDPHLRRFLQTAQRTILEKNFDALKNTIRSREIFLKGESRAKTAHPGEFDPTVWIGGGRLDYRFTNARMILRDIFEGEAEVC